MANITFHWADILVFLLFLVISLSIGLYHAFSGGKQRTTGEFILANRQLKVIPTMISLAMSSLSAILILGVTAEMYNYGLVQVAWFAPALAAGLTLAERVIVPWLYPIQLVSVYDYLELRFKSRSARYLGTSLGILNGILYIGVATFAPSIALEAVTGFSMYISIPLMSVLATVYTSLGGMRAVIWTDVFQGLVMVIGMLAVLIKGIIVCGGFQNVINAAVAGGRVNPIDYLYPDPRERNQLLAIVCGGAFTMAFMQGLQQAAVQRYSAVSSVRNARLTMLGNIGIGLTLKLMSCIIGLSLFSYFALERCDPLLNKDITSPNQILPFFVMRSFQDNKGFTGLFMATLYSGALSSISSSLSGSAANIWEDLLKRRFGPQMSEYQAAVLNKCLVVVCGVLGTGVAFGSAMLPGPVTQVCLTFFGACGGPLLGMFLLGGAFRFTNWIGACAGGISGFFFLMWIGAGALTVPPFTKTLPPSPIDGCPQYNLTSTSFNYTEMFNQTEMLHQSEVMIPIEDKSWTFSLKDLYQTSFQLFTLIGCFMCIAIGIIVSLITRLFMSKKEKDQDIPELYFINWRRVFCLESASCLQAEVEKSKPANKIYKGDYILPLDVNGTNHTEQQDKLMQNA